MGTKPRVLVLRAPGTNCDVETAYAFEVAGAVAERVHVARLLESPQLLRNYQILCIPGGFSYGDDIAAGRILATQLRVHLGEVLAEFCSRDRLVLGICNGFQVLLKAGLLVAPRPEAGIPATLTWNDTGRFEDRWVYLRVVGEKCVFLRGIDRMYLPVAHAEGKFLCRDEATLRQLEAAGQLVLRYALPPCRQGLGGGSLVANQTGLIPFPYNPNGSQGNVAGMCDETGRIFGLMPHPERHIDPTHHPRWTRGEAGPEGDGLRIFRNAVEYFAG
ncbi:MAG: phosphoribosylformylglycinamidine synthase I [Thermoguttaceae bacterium]|nr:phosphoribosylformylglycinamidine synthase I [Thermoguttaceae bacterium]MDW8080143.1 phosphoribosylformylglycinamidine synthase I [Thermoguttaceae bacterium]